MALIIKIQVNQELIRVYSAQNTTGGNRGVNEYLIQEHQIPQNKIKTIGYLSHKYEDGADILALK